jgi:hypothetical protein
MDLCKGAAETVALLEDGAAATLTNVIFPGVGAS